MYIAVKQETATSLTALLTKESNSHAIKSAAQWYPIIISHDFPHSWRVSFHEGDLDDRVVCTD